MLARNNPDEIRQARQVHPAGLRRSVVIPEQPGGAAAGSALLQGGQAGVGVRRPGQAGLREVDKRG